MISDAELDQLTADDVLALWARVVQAKEVVGANPDFRAAILRRLERLDPDTAALVRADLNRYRPSVVFDAWRDQLAPDRPALGAYPQPELPGPDPVAWFGAKPLFVTAVQEMARFTSDRVRVVEAGIELADQLGVPQAEADAIIASVIHGGRKRAG